MTNDLSRYARQIALPHIGRDGQERLARARALVVGAGGLGSPIALYLAAAGVGTLGLVDDDRVSVSNLQRQVLYTEGEVGEPKAACAARRLKGLNSTIDIRPYPTRLTAENAEAIIAEYDIVVDGCDNFSTRYLIDDVCRRLGRTYIFGAIAEYSGQVAVFDYQGAATYRTLYPDEEYFCGLDTAGGAVIGFTPAVVGTIEAAQAISIICGIGEPLRNELLSIDLLAMEFNRIKL